MASLLQEIQDNLITILGEIEGLQGVGEYIEVPETMNRPAVMVYLKGGNNTTGSDKEVNRRIEIQVVCIGAAPGEKGLTAKQIMTAVVAKLFESNDNRTLVSKIHQLTFEDWESLAQTKERNYSAEVPRFIAKVTTPEGVI